MIIPVHEIDEELEWIHNHRSLSSTGHYESKAVEVLMKIRITK